MKKFSKIINRCQFSKKKDLKTVLSLGYLPAVNNLEKISNKSTSSTFFPTDLLYSPSSKLYQINNIISKNVIFPKTYPYTSSTTKILRENFTELFYETKKLINLNKNDLVVDIGSNDGNLLKKFKNVRVLGVTPEDIGRKAIKDGIPTILNYFNTSVSKKILKKYGKAKVITATNVFAHIDDINKLIKNILRILKNDGIFITESHYFLSLIETLQYDTIYHEHLRYYTLTSLKKIFQKYKLKIIFAKKIGTHGGSIRVYATREKKKTTNKNVLSLLKTEKKKINSKSIKKFKDGVVRSKIELISLIKKIKKNKIIFGVGAPSRATTLVNYVGLDSNIIKYICEVKGSHKIGHYLPGTKIPIVDEKIIFQSKPDYLILFSWHISKELIKIFKKKGYKGKFIIPLPKPKII